MKENCKTCKRECSEGIWLSPQFKNEKVLLFCGKECKKKYLLAKLERIKVNYPDYYKKVKNNGAFWIK